ncbi:BTAD domain-containing putative transcriptional regulator [Micromonospora sp. MS34]|uniref:nSTAND1 domain-containing NTPase n=1 Tax=Micromonospora sp. MS34 TaxID=3385971 RepID=UPI00399FF374
MGETDTEYRRLPIGTDPPYRAEMHVRVLGPVVVQREGASVTLGGRKQRTVLALLAARVREVVSIDALIDGLWGDEPTPGARSTLQTYVSNLRAAVGDVIVRDGGGYRLQIDPRDVDAVQFEEAVERARELVETNPPEAAQRLRAALALWRGHPYADVIASFPLELEAQRLEELRLAAVETRIEAELAMGYAAELVAELEVVCSEYPFREEFRAQHMLALYRSGRRAEALRAYQKTRTYLIEELGLDTSTRLRQLEQQILNHAPALDFEVQPQIETLAFLLTDIEDSTVLWELRTEEMRAVVKRFERIVRSALEAVGGRIVKRVGDGMDTVFADVGAAVAAAEDIQRELAAVERFETGPLLVRMAIDVGEVESRDGDYFGPVLNRAGRILASGHGGQVLLSGGAHAALAGREAGWQAKALGEYRYKGIGSPVSVFQLLIDGLSADFPPLRIDRLPPQLPVHAFGRSVRGYELREEVGRGDFAVVFRAYQPSVGREVVIKIIRPEFVNQPAFVRSFEAEARIVAQLEHPHVVSLYDYWRDPDGAYLVMRWLRGGSLRDALERGPWNTGPAIRLLDQVRAALSYAHRRGVVHGGLKPTNVVLDEDGNAYLSDFGIASRLADLSESPRVASPSPAYVTPEELRGEPRTVRSDLYCLGLLTFELVTGRRPPMDGRLPSVNAIRPEIPAMLDTVVAKATADDPDDRYESVDVLVAAVAEALGKQPRDLDARYTAAENPYKGLRAFGEADAEQFHGRESVVEELLATLGERRLVAVVGPSGIGKSSIVRAGLVPAVRQGRLPASESWAVTDMFPGSYPFDELAAALLRVGVTHPPELVDELARDELGVSRQVKRLLPPDTGLLLVIDQFEELFTLTTDKETRRRFLDGLTRLATDARSRTRVVLTLRADFLDHPLSYPEFGELLRQGMCAVTVPSEDDLAAAIERPAAQVGVRFAPGLVSQIVADVRDQPGALPLLQYALTELFAGRTNDLLTEEGYRATGGVVGALGRRAEELYQGLDPSARKAVRQVFLRLVTVDTQAHDTRRRVRRRELRQLEIEPAVLDEVLDRYGEHRLLAFDREPLTRSPTVDVAHEALLGQWERFRSWIDERREDLLLQRRLRDAVEEWESSGRDDGYLPLEGRLAQFESWAAATDIGLTGGEREYLATGRVQADERRRRTTHRRRAVVAVLAAAAAISLLLAAVALLSRERAKDQEAVATSRELAASAIAVLDRDPELSVLLALEAAKAAEPTYEAVSALHEALREHRTIWTMPGPKLPPIGRWAGGDASLGPDGRSLLSAGTNRLEVWDVGGHEPRWGLELDDGELVSSAHFTRDGSQIVGAVGWSQTAGRTPPRGARPGIHVWDAASGQEVRYVPTGACPLRGFVLHGPFIDLSRPLVVVARPRVAQPATGGECDFEKVGVTLFDLESDAQKLLAVEAGLNGASRSADGRYVALAGQTRTWVVDTVTGRDVFSRAVELGRAAVLNADGSRVVTGGNREPLTLWDVRSGDRLRTLGDAGIESTALQFDKEEKSLLVIGSFGSGVFLYDVTSGSERMALRGHEGEVTQANLSENGLRLATRAIDGEVRVWDLSARGEVGGFALKSGTFLADGIDTVDDRGVAWLFTSVTGGDLIVFDPSTGAIATEIPHITGQLGALSPDGGRVAAQQLMSEAVPRFGAIRVHDLQRGTVTTMQGLCVYVELEENPQCRKAPETPYREWVWSLDFSPDGSLLAAGGYTSGVSVWDSRTGELRFNSGSFSQPTASIDLSSAATVAFSPDGRHLVASAEDEFVVYDVATWTELVHRTFEEGWLRVVHFTPDGGRLVGVSQRGNVVLVDPDTWVVDAVLTGHRGVLKDVDVSPDGAMIASSDSTGLIRVWDTSTGAPLQAIPLQQQVQNVEFVDDHHLLVTLDEGPDVYVMTVDVDELLDIARRRVTRGLTDEECRTYLHVDRCSS